MNENLKKLYDRIYEDESTKNPKKLIEIIDSNIELIDNLNLEEYDDYYMATRLVSDYAISLIGAGYLRKSLPYLNKAIYQMENDKKLKDKNLFKETLYESLIWNRGIANYNLQNYKLAKRDFEELVANFPENDKYRNWFKASTDYKYKYVEWIFLGITVISIILSFATQPDDRVLRVISLYGIIGGILISALVNFYRNRRMKMKK